MFVCKIRKTKTKTKNKLYLLKKILYHVRRKSLKGNIIVVSSNSDHNNETRQKRKRKRKYRTRERKKTKQRRKEIDVINMKGTRTNKNNI